MTTGRWLEKIAVYREYMRSPELPERFKTNWYIVLTVTTSPKRIASLANKTVEAGGRRGFWYTIAGEVSPETVLSNIWLRASDMYELRNERVVKLHEPREVKRLSILDALRRDNG